ncbi:MAG: hypothetical protein AB7F19_07545 [Candidatus Babeliales bacterium]
MNNPNGDKASYVMDLLHFMKQHGMMSQPASEVIFFLYYAEVPKEQAKEMIQKVSAFRRNDRPML